MVSHLKTNIVSFACIALAHAGLALAKGGGGGGHSTSSSHGSSGGKSSSKSTTYHGHTIIITHTTSNTVVCTDTTGARVTCPPASKKTWMIIGIVIGAIVFLLIVAFCLYRFWWTRRLSRFTNTRSIENTGIDDDEAHLRPKDTTYIPVSGDGDDDHDHDERYHPQYVGEKGELYTPEPPVS